MLRNILRMKLHFLLLQAAIKDIKTYRNKCKCKSVIRKVWFTMVADSGDDLLKQIFESAKQLCEEKQESSMWFSFHDNDGECIIYDKLKGSPKILAKTAKGKAMAMVDKKNADDFHESCCCVIGIRLLPTIFCNAKFPVMGVVGCKNLGNAKMFVVTGSLDAKVDLRIAKEALERNGVAWEMKL